MNPREMRQVLSVTLLVLCCSSAIDTAKAKSDNIPRFPTVVEYDVTFEFQESDRYKYTVLFAHGAASQENMSTEVSWAEPQWHGWKFPTYPVSLKIVDTTTTFSVSNSFYDYSMQYPTPIGKRPGFGYTSGGYPIQDVRFALAEHKSAQWYYGDIENASPQFDNSSVSRDEGSALEYRILDSDPGMRKILYRITNEDGRLEKDVRNEYAVGTEGSFLQQQDVQLYESPIPVHLESPIEFWNTRETIKIYDFIAPYHRGGRRCSVEYTEVNVGQKTVSLPISIEVHKMDDGSFMRRATIANLRVSQDHREASRIFSSTAAVNRLPEGYMECRSILGKYWRGSDVVSEKDVSELVRFRDNAGAGFTDSAKDAEKCFMYIHILYSIDILLGDEVSLAADYQEYCNVAVREGLPKLVAYGGLALLRLFATWKDKQLLGDYLLPVWSQNVCIHLSPHFVYEFCELLIAIDMIQPAQSLLDEACRVYIEEEGEAKTSIEDLYRLRDTLHEKAKG